MKKLIYSALIAATALTTFGAKLTNEKFVTNKVDTAVQNVETRIVNKITTDASITNMAAVVTANAYTDSATNKLSTAVAESIASAKSEAITSAKTYTDTEVAKKQDVIEDLEDIRSGSTAGSTAVQPDAISDMETKTHAGATYQPKGNYITSETDPNVSLQNGTITIKGSSITPLTQHQSLDAYDTRDQVNQKTNDVLVAAKTYVDSVASGKQDVINDLTTIRSGAAAGATAVQPAAIADMETKTHAGSIYLPSNGVSLVDGTITIKGQSITPLTEHQSLDNFYTREQVDKKTNDVLKASKEYTDDIADAAKDYTDKEVAKKQDIITDISDIRSGATAGSTAVQPAALNNYYNKTEVDSKNNILATAIVETNNALVAKIDNGLLTKQNIIEDLEYIRQGATKGFNCVQTNALRGITFDFSKNLELMYAIASVARAMGASVTNFVEDCVVTNEITYDFNNVVVSTDKGATWERLSEFKGGTFKNIIIKPTDEAEVYTLTYILNGSTNTDTFSDGTDFDPFVKDPLLGELKLIDLESK